MDTVTIELSPHAVERFHERVRPALTRAAAEDELAWLLAFAVISPQAPAWLARTARQSSDVYAVIGDIVLPLTAVSADGVVLVAKTCIPRGGISKPARERRNARRRTRHGRVRSAA